MGFLQYFINFITKDEAMTTHTNTSGTEAQNRSIADIASGDDAFNLIQKNKVWIGLVIAIIVIAVLGWGYYSTHRHQVNETHAKTVLNFQNGSLKDFSENKIDGKKASDDFVALMGQVAGFEGALPIGIQLADSLLLNKSNEDALKVLAAVKSLAKNDYARYFILSREAVAFEDAGKLDEAIKALEELASNNLKLFEGKTYLDLGRLYLKKGDKDKARKNFEYVVSTAKDEVEFVKIANLYLGQM